MKICYLSDINSAHTKKWCKYFVDNGHDVYVISLRKGEYPGAKVYSLEVDDSIRNKESGSGKFEYLKKIKKIKKIVHEIKPDLLHAHYASSYGLFGALCNYHPYIISLWGSDILLFPKQGIIQRNIIKYNFKKADMIFSTSRYMENEAVKYTNKPIEITPFGIDFNIFNNKNIRNEDEVVIGIVKALEQVYGIDYLIKAFNKIINKYPDKNIKLKILGEGTQSGSLRELVDELEINDNVEFLKPTNLEGVSDFYNKINIAVFPSISESFGVAVIEAQACGVPVIVSDIPAFNETTIPGKTSLICRIKDVDTIVDAVEKLVLNKAFYKEMSKNAEIFVKENFDVNEIFKRINMIYKDIVKHK